MGAAGRDKPAHEASSGLRRAGRTALLQRQLGISSSSALFRSQRPRPGRFAAKPVSESLVITAQSVVNQQSHHTLPRALLEGSAGLCVLAGLGAGGGWDDLFAG